MRQVSLGSEIVPLYNDSREGLSLAINPFRLADQKEEKEKSRKCHIHITKTCLY